MKNESDAKEEFVVVKGRKHFVKNNYLDLSYLEIADIQDIEGFVNISDSIVWLNLRGNNLETISDLPLMPNLKSLDLDQNRLRNFENLENAPRLMNLNAAQNEISSMDSLTSLNTLMNLDLSENNLVDLSGIESLHGLEELSLRLNSIYEISNLGSLNKLKLLLLSKNNIKVLDGLENDSEISTLWIDGNQITSIDKLSECKNLAELDIRDNQITTIDVFTRLPNLNLVHAENNLIKILPPLDTFMHANSENVGGCFYFSYNQIERIIINHDIIVESLYLDHNRITDASWIPRLWISPAELFIDGNPFTPDVDIIFDKFQAEWVSGKRRPQNLSRESY